MEKDQFLLLFALVFEVLLWDFLHFGPWQTRTWHKTLNFYPLSSSERFSWYLDKIHHPQLQALWRSIEVPDLTSLPHEFPWWVSCGAIVTCWPKHLALQIVLVIYRWTRLPNGKTIMRMNTNVALPWSNFGMQDHSSIFGFHIGFLKFVHGTKGPMAIQVTRISDQLDV